MSGTKSEIEAARSVKRCLIRIIVQARDHAGDSDRGIKSVTVMAAWKLLARQRGRLRVRVEYKYPRSIRGEVEKYDRSWDFHTYSFRVPGSSIHIKSTGFFLYRVNVSVILRSSRRRDGSYAILSEYQDPGRTCSYSIGTAGAEAAVECVYIRTRRGRADHVALCSLDVNAHYKSTAVFRGTYKTVRINARKCRCLRLRFLRENTDLASWRKKCVRVVLVH